MSFVVLLLMTAREAARWPVRRWGKKGRQPWYSVVGATAGLALVLLVALALFAGLWWAARPIW